MKARSNTSTVGLWLFVAIVGAGIGGWVANIVKLAAMISDPLTGMFVLRCVGIFVAPFGSVLGFV